MSRLLRLVGQGQGTDPPKRRKGHPSPALSLTTEEARAVRASARNIARQHFGTLTKLASALGVDPRILTRRKHPSPGLRPPSLSPVRVATPPVSPTRIFPPDHQRLPAARS
jgi:hypothetical protein